MQRVTWTIALGLIACDGEPARQAHTITDEGLACVVEDGSRVSGFDPPEEETLTVGMTPDVVVRFATCAPACSSHLVASCSVSEVEGSEDSVYEITASATYDLPVADASVDCPAICGEFVARCGAPALVGEALTIRYGGAETTVDLPHTGKDACVDAKPPEEAR